MKKTNLIFFLILICSVQVFAQAKTLSFESVWQKINSLSLAQDSSRLQTESLIESENRVARHWLPKLYLDAKTYHTNDPGASFFALLEQRALNQSDFNPDLINHPDSHLYTRGALGLDLPLYEGGMKSSQVDLYKYSVTAQKNTTLQIQLDQYSAVGLAYGSLAVIEKQKRKLQTVSHEISKLLKSYQLGSKSNPVGYSGLLGMKSLENRIQGILNQYESQNLAYVSMLRELGLSDDGWTPDKIDSNEFVSKYFVSAAELKQSSPSYQIEAAKNNAKASVEMANMQQARFLPRVGAFAESYMFNGSRETANGYNAGLYLQWNLFDPADFGSLKEAKLKSQASQKYSEAREQQERAEWSGLNEQLKALRLNLNLLNESYKLLSEQSEMTMTLFKNGAISALQTVEVLNRGVDLIAQQGEAEFALIKAGSQIILKQKFEIEKYASSGVEK